MAAVQETGDTSASRYPLTHDPNRLSKFPEVKTHMNEVFDPEVALVKVLEKLSPQELEAMRQYFIPLDRALVNLRPEDKIPGWTGLLNEGSLKVIQDLETEASKVLNNSIESSARLSMFIPRRRTRYRR
jgi:hypothetical protein